MQTEWNPIETEPPGAVLILANPSSGARENRRRVEQLAAALAEHGLRAVTEWQKDEWPRRLREPENTSRWHCVVAAGGDGTVADVVNARPAAPLAVLPLGTENIFARHFRFSADVSALAATIAAGEPEQIDVAHTGQRDFCLLASAGFDAEVVRQIGTWRTAAHELRRLTRAHYLPHIVKALMQYTYPSLVLEADGRTVTGSQAFVLNLPCYALNLPLAAHADISDGMLDWVVLQTPGTWSLLSFVRAVSKGKHRQRPDVQYGRARAIRITSPLSVPVQIDGDPAGYTPVQFTISPYRLRVMRPRQRAVSPS